MMNKIIVFLETSHTSILKLYEIKWILLTNVVFAYSSTGIFLVYIWKFKLNCQRDI